MIDVGRHFFPKEYLKELIDVMALHNINYFHWHLTEDQGWRIEIKKYPKRRYTGQWLLHTGRRQRNCSIRGRTFHYGHSGNRHAGTYVGSTGFLSGTGMYRRSVWNGYKIRCFQGSALRRKPSNTAICQRRGKRTDGYIPGCTLYSHRRRWMPESGMDEMSEMSGQD